jgi:hypothetical protein
MAMDIYLIIFSYNHLNTMRPVNRPFSFFLIAFTLFSCIANKDVVQYEIVDGIYASKIFEGKPEKVYIDNELEFLYVFPLEKLNENYFLDTLNRSYFSFPQRHHATRLDREIFRTNGFDLDLITIPFKFRSGTTGVPPQLNTNLNASLYFGYRSDWYTLNYRKNQMGVFDRFTKHYGITFGFFTGFGATPINPWVTKDQVLIEYDGIVWSNGLALSFAVDYFTIGLGIGRDNLLDKNSSKWIYQNKPWLGLVLGINLN